VRGADAERQQRREVLQSGDGAVVDGLRARIRSGAPACDRRRSKIWRSTTPCMSISTIRRIASSPTRH
jgi:hypothetical protein